MSAEQYGASLLEEVQEEGLDKLLAELRHTVFPRPTGVLGIKQLDEILESVRYPSGEEPQSRPASRQTGWPPATAAGPYAGEEEVNEPDHDGQVDPPIYEGRNRPRPIQSRPKPATIEISSRQSATGKSHLLYYLCAIATLPEDVGGKASTVVYIDSDGRFSATRLMQIMQHHILTIRQRTNTNNTAVTNANAEQSESTDTHSADDLRRAGTDADMPTQVHVEARDMALEALRHIHVFRPQSSSQVISILDTLQDYLLDRSRHSSIYRVLGLLVLDSATAFYWQDRFDRDMARLEATTPSGPLSGPGPAPALSPTPTSQTIEKLQVLQQEFECVVAFTTNHPSASWSQSSSSSTTARANQYDQAHNQNRIPTYNQGHGQTGNQDQTQMEQMQTTPTAPNSSTLTVSPWTAYASLTLDLSRSAVLQFAALMTVDECLRDADKRFDAVRNAHFIAKLDERRRKPGRSRTEVNSGTLAGFTFKIMDKGVDTDLD